MEHTLPPLLLTSEPDSFAQRTFQQRIPRIIDAIIETNDYPADIVASLAALRAEIIGGEIQPLAEEASDIDSWNTQVAEHAGKTWLDLPWFWAEAYFYRRILQSTQYWQAGAFHHRDPYGSVKRAELSTERAPRAVSALLKSLPADVQDSFCTLLQASLWGNRVDLSMSGFIDTGSDISLMRNRANLLVDDSLQMWAHLQNAPQRIAILCDNAGTELCFDLALVDFLLHSNFASKVTLCLKPQPTFVSDATLDDVRAALEAFAHSSAAELPTMANRLVQASHEKRFILTDHPFWVTGYFFHEMPDDLRNELTQATLVISKGDANYRRMIGDCHWPPTGSFESAVAYFPTPVVALRTLKSELVVGLTASQVDQLQAQDPTWRVSGRYGVIQMAQAGGN